MTLHDFTYAAPNAPNAPALHQGVRRWAAAALRACSQLLDHWAQQLTACQLNAEAQAQAQALEFQVDCHRDAGAPEGALFVNGQRIGTLRGVTRL